MASSAAGRDRRTVAAIVAGALVIAAAALVARQRTGESQLRLHVYASSTMDEMLTQRVVPMFVERAAQLGHITPTVRSVFGASGTIAADINLGAPADVAILSHPAHVEALRIGRTVRADAVPTVVCRTPLAIGTRPGNPRGIREYRDLAAPGTRIVHPDPRTSGAGIWAVLGAYGEALLGGADEEAARAVVGSVWSNVRAVAPSARGALTLFELGVGDALVTYEQDLLFARDRGVDLEVVMPRRPILAELVAVVVDENVTARERDAAEAFVQFLQGPEGQDACEAFHLRRLADGGPTPIEQPFTADDLGGWRAATADVVDGFWAREIEPVLTLEPLGHALPNRSDQ